MGDYIAIGVIKGDTRSLDSSSYNGQGIILGFMNLNYPVFLLRRAIRGSLSTCGNKPILL